MFFCFLQQKNKKMLFFKRENAKTQRKKLHLCTLTFKKGISHEIPPKFK